MENNAATPSFRKGQVVKSTTSPLGSGHVTEAATPLLGSTRVVKSTTSPLRSGHVVYDVWLMTDLKNNRRIASKATLHEAYQLITSEHRKEYVYILKWTPAFSVPKHIWGCLCGRAHTNDLRAQVRAALRSD